MKSPKKGYLIVEVIKVENIKEIPLTEADYLLICSYRGMFFDTASQRKLTRLLAGRMGEDEVVEVLERYLAEGWVVLRNVWLEINGAQTEIDILIITPKCWWVLEVKNYTGKFEYRDQLCFLNQKQIPDQLAAYRNRMRIVKQIVREISRYAPTVYGAMVFINESCQVVCEALPDCRLVMRHQLVWHIKEIIELHQQLSHYTRVEDSLTLLRRFGVENPFQPTQLSISDFPKLTKGFCCPKCHQITSGAEHLHVRCENCQHRISKSEAVLRAACELGMLYFEVPNIITTANLYEFTGGAVNLRTIRNILKAHFPASGKNSATSYHNYGLSFEEIEPLLREKAAKGHKKIEK